MAERAGCRRCGAVLAKDHTDAFCSPCTSKLARAGAAPIPPSRLWERADIRAAIKERHVGRLLRAYRRAQTPPISQQVLAEWLLLTQGHLSIIERTGRPVTDLEKLQRWCDALHVPDHLRWFRGPRADTEHRAARDAAERLGLEYAASLPATVETVAKLGRGDMQRRHFLAGAAFAAAASVAPSRDWLVATLDEATDARGKVGSAQVAAIRRMFGTFQQMDVMRGGGHARKNLASYLESHVVPLLRTNDPDTPTGRALYEAAAEQLYLLGWMSFDNGEHPLAQRYLIQALRLAQASSSPELGAHILAGLSDQATLTGHPDQGVQLARAGCAGLQRGSSPACLADLRALQARAEAAMGDARGAARSVHLSEQAFDDVDHDNEPEWARFIDVAYLNGEYAHAFRDLELHHEATRFATISAEDAARQGRARRGSLANAALARAALGNHDLEAAGTAARATVELAATVQSSRSVDAVADLRARLRPHVSSPAVRDFFDASASLMPTSA